MKIGDWVKRTGQKWHLVESVVDGDAITRCGRRMNWVTSSGGPLWVSDVMPLTRMIGQPQLCKGGCERGELLIPVPTVPEDDPTTSPTDPTTDTP